MIRPALPFAAAAAPVTAAASTQEREPTQEERAARRFPQPVRVGFLIGLPVLDENSTIVGRVRQVVRGADGKVRLVSSHGGVLGIGARLIALPVERVAMLGAHVAAVDMPRADMDAAPDWRAAGEASLGPSEVVRIGLTRR